MERRFRVPRRAAHRIPAGAVAGVAYAALAAALFWPALAGRRVLSAATDAYAWPPWTAVRPPGLSAYLNPLLSDHTRSFYPWLQWARAQLHAGHLPQWNPMVLSGTPFLANGQSQLFSLFSVPVWILPFQYGLGVSAVLRLLAGAAGAYLLARELDLGRGARLLAGLAFGFSPFFGVWLYHPLSSVIALLPWAVLFAERILRRSRGWDVAGLAAATGILNLGGYPEGQLQAVVAVVVYAAVRAGSISGLRARVRAGKLGLVVLGTMLGACLAAFLLVPVALGIPGTAGVAVRAGGGGADSLSALRTVAFPDWWGRPSGVVAPGGGPDNFQLRLFSPGSVALLLGAAALLGSRGWRRKAPLVALAALGFALPLGIEPLHWLVVHTPGLDHSILKLFVVDEQFAVALLAAMGLDELLRGRHSRRWAIVVASAMATGAVAVAALGPGDPAVDQVAHHFRTGADVHGAQALALVSVTWWIVFTAGFAGIVAAHRRLPPAMVAGLAALLVAGDAAHFFAGYQPMPPAAALYPETDAIRYLQARRGQWRIAGLSPALPADTATVYGLRDIRGLDPSQPTVAYARLMRLGATDPTLRSNTSVSRLTPARMTTLDLLGARYLLTAPTRRLPGALGLRRTYEGDDAAVYENPGAVPRASVPATVILRRGDAAARAVLASPGFQAAREAVVNQAAPAGLGVAAVVADTGEQVTLHADMRVRGLVVLADQWTPGWSVTVDGRRADGIRTDTALRGVVVDPGSHTIVWTYRTPGLTAGLGVTGATLAIGAAWAVRRGFRSRRRAAPPRSAGR